ncbi:uncharacterized protein METZ01_LOCUS220724, partial [marine metagenome]
VSIRLDGLGNAFGLRFLLLDYRSFFCTYWGDERMFDIRSQHTSGRFMAAAICITLLGTPALADLMIVGGDNKVRFESSGILFEAPGSDTVSVVDIGTDPANPKIIANLPLSNSVFGPPTNLVITPDESLALVTKAMKWTQ